ncbi:hypothetical protein AK972_5370 [Pseudomonas yamanorum]|nr:hypothetical protein AK972_5370 [Pseudomonas yamanorum]
MALQLHFKNFQRKPRASGVPLRFYYSKRHGVIVITGFWAPFDWTCNRLSQPGATIGPIKCNPAVQALQPGH